MDGVRLTDAQKHRLASQKEDSHSKKTFLGASSGTTRGGIFFFCENTGIHVFSEVFGLLWSLLGSTDELFNFVTVI